MSPIFRRSTSTPVVLLGGLKVTLNTLIYGVIIYLISLIVRVIQKPRL